MNKIIKILLLVVIVSLSALIVPLKGHGENIITDPVTVQELETENTREQVEDIMEVSTNKTVAINFEIDEAIENMNQEMIEIESIEDKKDWFIAYKNIIDKYSEILDPPETIYDYFSEEELALLFRVVQAEIGDSGEFIQKVNVASVIFNRLYHERFPDTLSEILVYDQFATISNGKYKEVDVTEDTILACEYAFQIEDTTNGSLFFDSNNSLNYEFVFNDSAHNFYKFREDDGDE